MSAGNVNEHTDMRNEFYDFCIGLYITLQWEWYWRWELTLEGLLEIRLDMAWKAYGIEQLRMHNLPHKLHDAGNTHSRP
jgi:hypothetical protein